MVVHDVEHHGEAAAVRLVDQAAQPVGAAVARLGGERGDAVVAPVARPGNWAIGMSSIAVTPRACNARSSGTTASNVPSDVNVPTWSS